MKKNLITILFAVWAVAATAFALVKTSEARQQRQLASTAQAQVDAMKAEQLEQSRLATQRLEAATKEADELRKQKEEEQKKK
jgi:hypothetical protein